jgi:hypothetical protein
VREVSESLHGLSKIEDSAFIKGYREKYGRRDGKDHLADAVKNSVSDKFPEIIGVYEIPEILEADPGAAGYAIEGLEIPEGDLGVPNGNVFEDNEVNHGNRRQKIYRLVTLDAFP